MMARFKKVPTDELTIDKGYQRPLDERRVAKMVADFRPEMLGVLEVSRHNGKCAVFDGQHRLAAAQELGIETLPCLVHEGMSREQEADLFFRLQRDRKTVHPIDAFRARLAAGDATVAEIYRLVHSAKFVIGYKASERVIAAVRTLEKLHQRRVLTETLELLGCWDGDPACTDMALIAGVGKFVEGYAHRITDEHREQLAAVPAAKILRNASSRQIRAGRAAHRSQLADQVVVELRKITNLSGPGKGSKKARAAA